MAAADWNSEIGKEWGADTWEETLDAILQRGTPPVIYRGQGDYEWSLTCTLSRALRDEARNGGPVPLVLLESMVADADLDASRRSRTDTCELVGFGSNNGRQSDEGMPELRDHEPWSRGPVPPRELATCSVGGVPNVPRRGSKPETTGGCRRMARQASDLSPTRSSGWRR